MIFLQGNRWLEQVWKSKWWKFAWANRRYTPVGSCRWSDIKQMCGIISTYTHEEKKIDYWSNKFAYVDEQDIDCNWVGINDAKVNWFVMHGTVVGRTTVSLIPVCIDYIEVIGKRILEVGIERKTTTENCLSFLYINVWMGVGRTHRDD